MGDAFPSALRRKAAAQGLLEPGAPILPRASGNRDRRDTARRQWLATAATGRRLLLTTGAGLAALAERQREFARACPGLVRAPEALVEDGAQALLVEEFFPGKSLSAWAGEGTPTPDVLRGLEQACHALAATRCRSTEEARRAEWASWSAALCTLPCWSPEEAGLLRETVLPALYAALATEPPAWQWTNGDFTADNLLLTAAGEARLVDFEHARRTHFFREDAARFHALSAAARRDPLLFAAALPPPAPAWHLYFWLRQLELECLHNTPAYLARVRPRRLGVVRRLAEQLLQLDLAGWSTEAQPVLHRVESARWPGDGSPRVHLAGWCHAPGGPTANALLVHAGEHLLARMPLRERPDVEQHFAGAAGSRTSGFAGDVTVPAPDTTLRLTLLDGEGTLLPFATLSAGSLPGRGPFLAGYGLWAARHDPDPPPPETPPAGPRFSILLPVYRSDPGFLRACLESVRQQHHPHWELEVVDDGSGSPELASLLREFAAVDRRIRLRFRPANGGIARATNDALHAARGDYIVLLDHDDRLRPHALAELAARLRREPALDVLYSDEEKISSDGERLLPFLKPAFSPEFLRGVMFPGHVLCVRLATARSVGGFDPAFDGVQDFEFFLRLAERGARIGHVPRILYQWRQAPASSALHGNIKGDMDRRQAEAVQAHLQRTGDARRAVALGGHRVRLEPTRVPRWHVVPCDEADAAPAALRQAAATAAPEDILVLLPRPPTDADEPWLREVAAVAALPDSGCAGPVLVDPAGRVAAAGFTREGSRLVPMMTGFDPAGDGYNGSLRCNREVLAVPFLGAAVRCAVMRETTRQPDWASFCLELSARGRFHRVCAGARLECNVTPSGTLTGVPAEGDAFYNPHFSRHGTAAYELAAPPPHLPAARPQAVAHFDVLPEPLLPDGLASVRGWCFRRDGRPVQVVIRTGHDIWTASCHLPRPDVAAAHPAGLTDGQCGFVLHFRLPAGQHHLRFEAWSNGQPPEPLGSHLVAVPLLPDLHRILATPAATLLAHQFSAGAMHPPRALAAERFPRLRRNNRPTLAIVTPSHQHAAFLEQTIHSVLEQPGVTCAYVVQDGGSTDGSVEIIRRHAARLHAWESRPDHGQADAIARAFAKTTGGPDDVMAWLNSDDFYLPGALGYVADYFARHPDVDVIYGHRVLVDESAREIGRWFLPRHDPEVLRLNDFVPQETLFWRRRLWDKVGGIDPSFRFAMDWDLLLRFQAAGANMVRVPYFLACFRIHPAQKTSAQMQTVGQAEIDRLRTRTFGRAVPPAELESHPRLLRHLRRSALIEFLWKLGFRAP
jgi:glycosyltransferase involved in cell wall biosynthesis